MQCRDAQFYLRLRRHAGDELGADTVADLGRHLAACPACAADAGVAESFDRAVAAAVRTVPVPVGLRDKLLTQASVHHGAVIRGRVYRVAALAASLLLGLGLTAGVFWASRLKVDTNALVMAGDRLYGDPEGALREWLVAQRFPDRLPEALDPDLLIALGKEPVQEKDTPVATFRHPTDRGFAKVYLFRTDGTYNLKDLQETQASHTMVRVINDPDRFPGVQYVILYTPHPVGPGEDPLKPFLRSRGIAHAGG